MDWVIQQKITFSNSTYFVQNKSYSYCKYMFCLFLKRYYKLCFIDTYKFYLSLELEFPFFKESD